MAITKVNPDYTVITGSATGSNGNRLDVWAEYKITEQSIENNKSYIRVYYYAQPNTASATYGGNGFNSSVTVNGASGTGLTNAPYDFRGTSASYRIQWGSYAGWISHNGDGTKTATVAGSFTTKSSYISGGSISKSITLPAIPRQATITRADNFNDEENPTISYSNPAGNTVSSLQACISLNGSHADIVYRDVSITGSTYTFYLTESERTLLRVNTTGSNSRTVYFYLKTVIGGNTFYSKLAKTFSIKNPNPTLSPQAYDINSATLALTGDRDKIIKYFSTIYTESGAGAVKNASIVQQSTTIGSISKSSATNTFEAVESGTVNFSVTDSRNNTISQTINKTLINYIRLTCDISSDIPTTDGTLNLEISGNYFNDTFGAVANELDVQYRLKENNDDYGEWIDTTFELNGSSFISSVEVTGLNYRSSYTFQARAVDRLTNKVSDEIIVQSRPVFDWGKEDFRHFTTVEIPNDQPIFSIDENGNQKNICSIDSIGGLILGGGENPPDSIKLIADDGDIQISNDGTFYSLLGLVKALTNSYEIEIVSTTLGTNYSSATFSANLIGNNLRCVLSATRKTNTTTGDMANETVVTARLRHSGKLKGFLNVAFNSGTTGGICSFQTNGTGLTSEYIDIAITLCSSTVAQKSFNASWVNPVTINLNNFV